MAYSAPQYEVAIKVREDKSQHVAFWKFGESKILDLETAEEVNTLIRLLENARDAAQFRQPEASHGG